MSKHSIPTRTARDGADPAIDWTTKPARLRVRRAGQDEVRAEVSIGQHADAIGRILDDLPASSSTPLRRELQAVGHRVVHGGARGPDVAGDVG